MTDQTHHVNEIDISVLREADAPIDPHLEGDA